MSRGYYGIGMYEPKFSKNVGSLMRHAQSLGARFTFAYRGTPALRKVATNTTKAERHVPHFSWRVNTNVELAELLPADAELIAIETGGVPLSGFVHPERAVYILGNESTGLPTDVLEQCSRVVTVNGGDFCMNVATAGAIVMWHRGVQ